MFNHFFYVTTSTDSTTKLEEANERERFRKKKGSIWNMW